MDGTGACRLTCAPAAQAHGWKTIARRLMEFRCIWALRWDPDGGIQPGVPAVCHTSLPIPSTEAGLHGEYGRSSMLCDART